MLSDPIIAAIRTGVASVVGIVVSWLIAQGFDFDEEFKLNAIALMTVLLIALYNFIVIVLEKKVNPAFGYLLGIPKAPTYPDNGTTEEPPVPTQLPAEPLPPSTYPEEPGAD